ncbi:TetR/AcrR family transcriptional regulator [Rhodococcoides fascians]|uniref:TetR/AcrR family transcriptional regulator n=1 Tax=Rhodococcoides fascians TaxID=1828 RepID=UPI0006916122|nr:TetR/AcrR family transcriptional regulator [Rhodococcus fascians]
MTHAEINKLDITLRPAKGGDLAVEGLDARTALGKAVRIALPLVQERRGTTIRDTEGVARRLATAALDLFEAHGFDNVTVTDIAERAGVTSRTFFRYFPNKETIVLDIWDQTNRDLIQAITVVAAQGTVLSVLKEATTAWIDEHHALLVGLAAITGLSRTLSSGVLQQSSEWEEHIADALLKRMPQLDRYVADMSGVVAMGALRVASRRVLADRVELALEVKRLLDALGFGAID